MPSRVHRIRRVSARPQAVLAVLLLVLLGGLSGCVQRRMMIRSNPPGALVYVDDYPIGTTPIATDFLYYGQRKIRLVKDGYETLTVMQSVPSPWYEIPPVDFVAENLVPGEIRDHRTFSYQLVPQTIAPTDQLLSRAESLRRGVVPAGAVGPATSAVPIPTLVSPGLEPIATPEGIGGQPVYPLSPGLR